MGERKLTTAGQKRKEIKHLRFRLEAQSELIINNVLDLKDELDKLVRRVAIVDENLELYFRTKDTLDNLTTKQRKPK